MTVNKEDYLESISSKVMVLMGRLMELNMQDLKTKLFLAWFKEPEIYLHLQSIIPVKKTAAVKTMRKQITTKERAASWLKTFVTSPS